jgi:hypothetical protein
MEGIDKDVCLQILDRGLMPCYFGPRQFESQELGKKEFFRGQAKNYERFYEPRFQEFIKKHNIEPETRIAVASMAEPDHFTVILAGGTFLPINEYD